MGIVTLTDFQSGKYRLPNAVVKANSADRTNLIQSYINDVERDTLTLGLGTQLYSTVNDALDDLENADQIIKDLVNGTDYTSDSKNYTWRGLKPMLIPIIYYAYLNGEADEVSTLGVERPDSQNSTSVSIIPRTVAAFRDFHAQYQGVNYSDHPKVYYIANINVVDWYNSDSYNPFRSLKQFLDDNETDYPTAEHTSISNINTFGI